MSAVTAEELMAITASRAAYSAELLNDITDICLYAQHGYFVYGFLGAAQVDMYGNINTSVIGSFEHPRVRLPGSGGANDIISLCNEVLIVAQHEPRRFVERVGIPADPVGPAAETGERAVAQAQG